MTVGEAWALTGGVFVAVAMVFLFLLTGTANEKLFNVLAKVAAGTGIAAVICFLVAIWSSVG